MRADMQVLAVHRRTRLPHLRVENGADQLRVVLHAERRAEIADHRRDDVAFPPAVDAAPARAAAQADGGGVDRLLAQRAEALPLERGAAPADFAAGEECLE